MEINMTKEQMYLLGFNTALDRVDEHIEELKYLDQCLGIQDVKNITEELRNIINETKQIGDNKNEKSL
jgi:hypothetical protein